MAGPLERRPADARILVIVSLLGSGRTEKGPEARQPASSAMRCTPCSMKAEARSRCVASTTRPSSWSDASRTRWKHE